MNRMLFVVMSWGIVSSIALAQDQLASDPLTQPRTVEGGYGERGGYGRGEGGYGGGGYGYSGEGGYGQGYGGGGFFGRGGGMAGQGNRMDPRQSQKLIERWKASKHEGERDNVERSLREMLKVEFGARLAAHENEIKQLEEKVRQLRQRLNLRREKQDEIVENRLQQLLRDAQGLGWGAEGSGGPTVSLSLGSTDIAPQTTTLELAVPQPTVDPQPEAGDSFSEDSGSIEPELTPSRN